MHPTLVAKWKKEALAGLATVFSNGAGKQDKDEELLREKLYEQIGRLKVENDWLVELPNKPTEGSGPRATFHPLLSVEYVGSFVEQLGKTALAGPRSCPNIGDHLNNAAGSAMVQSELPVMRDYVASDIRHLGRAW